MAILRDILYKVSLISVSGNTDLEIHNVQFDSRKVEPNSLFVAVVGTQVDGHQFINSAVEKGATAIVCEKLPKQFPDNVTFIEVADSGTALGRIASNFYGNPSSKLKLVGVTGTNGKTTTVVLMHQLFGKLGYNVGLISTVNNYINEEVLPATHTTPDALTLNKLLAEMLERSCTHCFMEVSSHALVQGRVAGLDFTGAIFTNISHDHLDYHKTFDEYIKAKKLLFDGLSSSSFALVNADDKRGLVMLQNTKATKKTFALRTLCDFKAKILSNTLQGLELEIDHQNVWFKLIGAFNAYNLIGIYAAAVLLGENSEDVLTCLSELSTAPGRFELVNTRTNIAAIVDYAHTPDALENVLSTIKEFRTGNEKVITVVGCGGNRDKEKRPIMANIATKYSDKVILTSDNPRDEDPDTIIKDMQQGVAPSNFKKTLAITDRKEAIKTACSLADNHDIILVAGKGHETYQEIKGVRNPFDDKKILGETLDMLNES
ncbi:UDP-N-acetylmuramoyl-L-alanyl-D-glutamate--2,6-diaminopimelate ligase [Fulvivirgaceae bacterium BMA10]|uniref:UDP-N-acetylmuramoyl-L-alanyl-D-glutamate--2,6-diaminopimelate ligase n=1 Tax=Splendidivirga corallicola TaxID=3051826 RepID=A0ABT8KMI9_9BACT|nr:UDP-N-acetylmuramoyl-L-alanyl-D-glutamate--2,6-diaminopimelate ligase [Fulvivirgaceae bacterium BMA10]